MATAADYRKLIVQARRRQLQATRENIQRLAETYDATARSIAAKVAALPDKESVSLAEYSRAQFQLLRDVNEALTNLKRDYGSLLDLSLLDSAQMTADRERQVAAMVAAREDANLFPDLERTTRLSNGTNVTIQFGRLAESAVEAITTRVYRDGLQLSNRLYNLDAATRKVVEDVLVQGAAEGVSAREIAARIRPALTEAGAANPRYQAMRIARTEVNNAHREATVRGSIDPATGALKPYIQGLRWNLSASHPVADICDVWASGGSAGLPPGVYLPADVPVDHPHGLCIPAGSSVAAPFLRGATSRRFRGEIVDIETVGGYRLSVTPNHPILSPEGWIGARLLRKGGDVICCSDAERVVSLVDPHNYQAPALIENVADALRGSRGMTARRVPCATEDFHGDGTGSEVCVIRADGLLCDSFDSALAKPFLEEPFGIRDADLIALACSRDLAAVFHTPTLAAYGGVGRRGYSAALLGRHSGEGQRYTLSHRAYLHSVPNEDSTNWGPRASHISGKRLDALASLIATDKIKRIVRRQFDGHVLNLHTGVGWYIASSIIPDTECVCFMPGIVVHNCFLTSELVDFPGIGGPGREPDVASVPQSQIDYYAAQGDPVAQAHAAAAGEPVPA